MVLVASRQHKVEDQTVDKRFARFSLRSVGLKMPFELVFINCGLGANAKRGVIFNMAKIS